MKGIVTFLLFLAVFSKLPDNAKAEPGDCTFNKTLCDYKLFDQDWRWVITTTNDYDFQDHTTNSTVGGFVAIDDNYKAKSTSARLYSPKFETTGSKQRCLTFWYRLMGKRIRTFRVITQDFDAQKTGGTVVWSTSTATNHYWTYAQVPISSNYTHVIHFEATRSRKSSFQTNNYIDIDDILFLQGPCSVIPDNAKTSLTPKPLPKEEKKLQPTPHSNSPNNCTFDANTLCTWKQDADNALNWTLRKGAARLSQYTGPKFDHTFGPGTKKGYYIYIDVFDKNIGKTARLLSADILPKDTRCLTFWYHMWGANINTLNVYAKVGNTTQVVWSRKKTQGNEWLQAHVDFSLMTEKFNIVFEAIAHLTSTVCSIALDDISLSTDYCPTDDNYCDFETSNCDYMTVGGSHIWKVIGKHYVPDAPIPTDHTYNTDYGHYMALDSSKLDMPADVKLKSPYLELSTTKCLKFWYFLEYATSTSFYVTLSHRENPIIEANYFRDFIGSWQVAQATINSTTAASQLNFNANIMSNTAFVAIDDIEITDGECSRPGECNFENGNLCTWNNGVVDEFDWQLQNGKTISTGTGPEADHTLGSSKGTYLYIETSSPRRVMDAARLYSHGFQRTGKPWKCLHFWYHMIGTDIGKLTVYQTFKSGNETALWQARGDQGRDRGSEWHYAQVPVPSNTASYQLILEATVGGPYGDIAIDDIVVTDELCSITPYNANNNMVLPLIPTTVPPMTKELYEIIDCSFLDNVCEWTNVNTSIYNNWAIANKTKTANQKYLPYGDLYAYAQNDALSPYYENVTYTLLTPELITKSKDDHLCFNFNYYMFGPNNGELTIYMDLYDGKNPTTSILWKKNRYSIDKWKRAGVTINMPDRTFRLRLVAMISHENVVAVENFQLQLADCYDDDEVCDFTMHSCGFEPDLNETVAWGVVRPTEVTNGPAIDHTSLTADGAFAFVENNAVPAQGRYVSPKYSKYMGPQCLSFWYYMSGAGSGLLSVQLKYEKGGNETIYSPDFWRRIGDRGNRWHRGEVTISTYEEFHIVFFANFTNTKPGYYMAIDDVLISASACDPPGSCSFDNEFCGFTNDLDQKHNWMVGSGTTHNPNIVSGPVFGADGYGLYAYMDYSIGQWYDQPMSKLRSEEFKGTLESPTFCLEFAYVKFEKYGVTSTLQVFVNRLDKLEGLKIPIWKTTETSSFTDWNQANVVFNCSSEFEIIFAAKNEMSSTVFIGIDEIALHSGPDCIESETEISNTGITDELYRCNFDDANKCDWVLSKDESYIYDEWTVTNALNSNDLGPNHDHTIKTNKGFYALADQLSTSSRMTTNGTITNIKPTCFQFWYNTYSQYSSTHLLQIYVRTQDQQETLVWNGTATSGDTWKLAQISITNFINYEIIIQAAIRRYTRGHIAIDDVVLLMSTCPEIKSCTFDDDMCLFSQSPKNRINWSLTQKKKPKSFPEDHTTNTLEGGNYLYLNTTSKTVGAHATLISPWLPAGKHCTHFWFYSTSVGAVLNIHKRMHGYYAEEPLNTFESIRQYTWLSASVEANDSRNFEILFEAIPGPRESSLVFALDDIEFTLGPCSSRDFCDFEKDLCFWQIDDDSDIKWERSNGYEIRKNQYNNLPDHTLKLPSGHTLLIETYFEMNGARAKLISPIVSSDYNCFSFWYFTNNVTVGTFQILKHSGAMANDLVLDQVDPIKEREWVQVKVNTNPNTNSVQLQTDLNFKLSLEFYFFNDRRDFFLAIDDFFLDTKTCEFSEVNIPEFVCNYTSPVNNCTSCNFENGTCNYEDASANLYHWRISLGNQTEANDTDIEFNIADHTKGTIQGHYMFAAVKGPRPNQYSSAKLHSPRYEYASTTCHMTFWIFLPKDAPVEKSLDVSIVYLTADAPLKITSVEGIAGQWALISVYIGSEQKPFRIEFEALNYYGGTQYIAIDDINMIDCSLKTKESETCNANEIRCSDNPKSPCINLSQKCDFNVDCIESTDETDCTNYTMCDFEDNNLCVWTTVWQGWVLSRANSFILPRDHTTNSREGNYLLADYISRSKQNKISSRTFKAGNCTMRFHYVLTGDGNQQFRVTTTTATNPEKVWFYKDRKWDKYFIRDEIQFSVDSDFIIALEANINHYSGYVVVDDISFDTDCQFADKELDGTVPTVCMEGQFACGDDTCIPKTSVCNFEKDCKDGSDEDNCGTCDFEDGECGWADSSVGMYRWKKTQDLSGTTPSPVSRNNLSKWVMSVVRTTNAYSAIPNAYLQSAVLGRTATTCKFIFGYHTKTNDGKFKLNVRNLAKAFEKTIAILNNSNSENWVKLTIPLGSFQPGYQIVFEADVTQGHFESDVPDFAVDDIQFINCSAVAEMTNPTYSDLNCTFENGNTCNWYQELAADVLDWQTTIGITNGTGPGSDHTNNNKGHYLFVSSYTPGYYSSGSEAWLVSPIIPATKQKTCLTFWYHMFGENVGAIGVSIFNATSKVDDAWLQHDSEGNVWRPAFVNIDEQPDNYQIVISGLVESNSPHIIAIDDIEYYNSACISGAYENNFETSDGGWVHKSSNTEDKWRVVRMDHEIRGSDHTTGTQYGHALNFNGNDGSTAVVSNPTSFRSSDKGSCFQFWYMMTDDEYSNIVVAKIVNSTRIHNMFYAYNPYEWHFGQITIPPSEDFKVDFTATVVGFTRNRHSFFLDDFIIRNESCLPDGSCDFESSSCGWSPYYASRRIKWLRSSAATPSNLTGPAVDATGNPKGSYLFLDSVLGISGEADLRSPQLQTESNTTCFSFSYHISGPDVGSLRVEVILSNYDSIEVFRVTSPREKKWIPVHLEIHNLTEYYFIRIVGMLNPSPMGDIAMDNFTVTPDICPQKLVLPPITITTTLRTTISTPSTTLKIKPVTTKQPTKKTTKSSTTKIITKPIEKSTTQRLSKTSTPSSLICADNEHSCSLNGKCIKSVYWCDGNKDCPSGEDEAKCEERKCPKETFSCASEPGKCIEKKRLCDGSFDCTDKSDESQCECYTDLCLNKAICTKQDKLAVCNCADNYHGNRCQFEALTKADEKPSNLGWVAAVVLIVILAIVAGTILYLKKYRNPNVTENAPMTIDNPMYETPTEALEYDSFNYKDPDTTIPSGLDETDGKEADGAGIVNPLYSK